MSEMIQADGLTYRYTDLSHTTHLALDGVNEIAEILQPCQVEFRCQ